MVGQMFVNIQARPTLCAGRSVPPATAFGEIPTWRAGGRTWRVISRSVGAPLILYAVATPVAMTVWATTPLRRRLCHAFRESHRNDKTDQTHKAFHLIILHPTASINSQSLSIALMSRRRSNSRRFRLQHGFGPGQYLWDARPSPIDCRDWRMDRSLRGIGLGHPVGEAYDAVVAACAEGAATGTTENWGCGISLPATPFPPTCRRPLAPRPGRRDYMDRTTWDRLAGPLAVQISGLVAGVPR